MSRRIPAFPWKKSTREAWCFPFIFKESGTLMMRIPRRHKSSLGNRPKRKVYHRVFDLDKAMDLRKKPSLILRLKSIIQSQKNDTLLLRDLEKQVGFVQKWNLMAAIEKYPTIFYVGGGSGCRSPPYVTLTDKACKVAHEEGEALQLMEPIAVNRLRKLLMLTVECRVPMEKVELLEKELGLPMDFKESLIPKYPQYFSMKHVDGTECLSLENWDSSLAVTAREEKLTSEGVPLKNPSRKMARISRDGNFRGPFAFKLCYAKGFRPNKGFLEDLEKWQRLEFPSPYLNARRFEAADPKTRKRMVGVLHELLSLTMEKRMTVEQLDAFHTECKLPSKLLLCLVKHHGIFYVTNKGARGTVILKEAYDGSRLIDKCPLLSFNDKFVALSGRQEMPLSNDMTASELFI